MAKSHSPRSARSVAEMVDRLRVHTVLLRKYMKLVQKGEPAYLGEIAAKVRLLAIEGGSNKALLLRVGKVFGGTAWVTLDGPPGWEFMDGHKAGDRITLEEWLDTFQLGVRTASSPDEPVRMTKREFVLVWAQQHGGAHEDWSLDERFAAVRDLGVALLGAPANDHILMQIAAVVLSRAEELLSHLTPEVIAEAEQRRQGGR